jgi:hypothetical protein
MYNALKNKKLIEISYIFLNKSCGKFYLIPPFYHLRFDNLNKVMRYQFYDNNFKELSVMMGTLALLINYCSKLFNIPLKYSVFVNGSRSYIFKDKKEYRYIITLVLYRYIQLGMRIEILNSKWLVFTYLMI